MCTLGAAGTVGTLEPWMAVGVVLIQCRRQGFATGTVGSLGYHGSVGTVGVWNRRLWRLGAAETEGAHGGEET